MNDLGQDTQRIADIVEDLTKPAYSEKELCHLLGISRDTLKRRITGVQPWRPGELQILANLSDIPVGQISGTATANHEQT